MPLGLAVSGGSDSLALLTLAAETLPREGLSVATVNHGLRVEADREVQHVAQICAELGVSHSALAVSIPSGGDLQARARAARYEVLSAWAMQEGLAAVALGHTQNDQAETFLIRLARGSGIDGLAGMPARFERHGVPYLRPLLGHSRDALKHVLRARGIEWCADPSNADTQFTRVQARQLQPVLSEFGVTPERLADTAHWMQAGAEVLELAANTWIADHAASEWGDAVLELNALQKAPIDTAARVVTRILRNISGRPYRPRFSAVEQLISDGQGTLHGCLAYLHKGQMRLTREPRAVEATGTPWDRRWTITGPKRHAVLRPLGEAGLEQLDGWRDTALVPRRSLLASPSIWEGDHVIAAPLAQPHPEWSVSVPSPLSVL